jgi:hypothetical protein
MIKELYRVRIAHRDGSGYVRVCAVSPADALEIVGEHPELTDGLHDVRVEVAA